VALLVGRRTCDLHHLQVAVSSPGWATLRNGLGHTTLHLCASVSKHYNLVPAKGGDLFGWESNRGLGGK